MKPNWFPPRLRKDEKAITENHTFAWCAKAVITSRLFPFQNSQFLWVTNVFDGGLLTLSYAGCLKNAHSLSSEVLNLSILQPPSLSSNYICYKKSCCLLKHIYNHFSYFWESIQEQNALAYPVTKSEGQFCFVIVTCDADTRDAVW